MAVKWDETRVAVLMEMWMDGNSAYQIADRLGGVTRSAVLGKLNRLQMLGSRTEESRYKKAKVKKPKIKPSGLRKTPGPVPVLAAPTAAALVTSKPSGLRKTPGPLPVLAAPTAAALVTSLMGLEAGDCRFPIGDTRDTEFSFCRKPSVSGSVYCADCREKAYPHRRAAA